MGKFRDYLESLNESKLSIMNIPNSYNDKNVISNLNKKNLKYLNSVINGLSSIIKKNGTKFKGARERKPCDIYIDISKGGFGFEIYDSTIRSQITKPRLKKEGTISDVFFNEEGKTDTEFISELQKMNIYDNSDFRSFPLVFGDSKILSEYKNEVEKSAENFSDDINKIKEYIKKEFNISSILSLGKLDGTDYVLTVFRNNAHSSVSSDDINKIQQSKNIKQVGDRFILSLSKFKDELKNIKSI